MFPHLIWFYLTPARLQELIIPRTPGDPLDWTNATIAKTIDLLKHYKAVNVLRKWPHRRDDRPRSATSLYCTGDLRSKPIKRYVVVSFFCILNLIIVHSSPHHRCWSGAAASSQISTMTPAAVRWSLIVWLRTTHRCPLTPPCSMASFHRKVCCSTGKISQCVGWKYANNMHSFIQTSVF